ncbi:hypothetical protein KC334_g9107, partial [Hortaea werneckii]
PQSNSSSEAPAGINGSIHQPPPADDESDSDGKRASDLSNVSASISGPQDLVDQFSGSNESGTPTTSTPRTSVDTALKGAAKYKLSNADPTDSPSSPAGSVRDAEGTPAKRDSLNRRPARKGTGGLQRQSVIMSGKRGSVDSGEYTESPVATESSQPQEEQQQQSKGVQLEDKPMDFD